MHFQLGVGIPPPLAGLQVVPPFHFVLVFAFLCLAPPAMLAVRGRFLTLVSLIIAPAFSFNRLSSSRPPRPRWRSARVFLAVVCLIIAPAFSFNCFSSRFSWLHSLAVQRFWGGFRGATPSTHVLVTYLMEPGFPRMSHISAHEAHQDGLVL